MVIPMQVAPPPAEILPPPAPGAPSTIAVDTSNAARVAQGLPAAQNALRNRNATNAPRNANATRRVGFNTNANANTGTVSVNKLGASNNGPPPAANVRVNVMKQGQAPTA